MTTEVAEDPSVLLPSARQLRSKLAKALRDVEVLRGLLKVAERAEKRDGQLVARKPQAEPTVR